MSFIKCRRVILVCSFVLVGCSSGPDATFYATPGHIVRSSNVSPFLKHAVVLDDMRNMPEVLSYAWKPIISRGDFKKALSQSLINLKMGLIDTALEPTAYRLQVSHKDFSAPFKFGPSKTVYAVFNYRLTDPVTGNVMFNEDIKSQFTAIQPLMGDFGRVTHQVSGSESAVVPGSAAFRETYAFRKAVALNIRRGLYALSQLWRGKHFIPSKAKQR